MWRWLRLEKTAASIWRCCFLCSCHYRVCPTAGTRVRMSGLVWSKSPAWNFNQERIGFYDLISLQKELHIHFVKTFRFMYEVPLVDVPLACSWLGPQYNKVGKTQQPGEGKSGQEVRITLTDIYHCVCIYANPIRINRALPLWTWQHHHQPSNPSW